MKKADNRSGFTMVEIIAVLVIIGIMAAVAAPKFINMAEEARNKAAIAGINEAKATLTVAYSKAYLENDGVQPTIGQVYTNAFGNATATTDLIFGDVVVRATITDPVVITAITLDDVPVTASDEWDLPTQ
jgi:MSHA pilin protein MshA